MAPLKIPETDGEAQDVFRRASKEWLGGFGEAIWSRTIAASGWHYVSLTKICEGGAPLARGKSSQLILPDFDAYRDGKSVFVESKVKTRSIVYYNKRQERHGINERNYRHYLEVQRRSGKPCCIALVELWRENVERPETLYWSGSLLFEKLSDLVDPRSEYPEPIPKVYWKRKQFRVLEEGLTPIELFQRAAGIVQVGYEFEINSILFPQRQTALF